ncbi:acetyl-CoA carboxylase biotin carboxylase subunit [Thalassotalea aquiviva]|uniref:acetyl/propionyl/methylcrotonyl-CoA carboxylase subunit alpha n=1 Tax=Thalassotalea aquiviva TaxID=3242415 RepID=UPI00352A7ADE
MFTKILIANRGEIACRVIKTAKHLGIATVAIYSDADSDAKHVNMADEAVYIGPSPSRDSYLAIDKVIDAALKTNAQAIHPGYGFLSENANFCQACAEHNIVFIGPGVEAIKAMGSKSAAKTIMEQANVPLVPGYHGDDQSISTLKKVADNMGYPVLLKASAGGGGKGMRQVWSSDEFEQALAAAKRESMSSFGDDQMLVEKYLTQPRHVEIQVFCDQHNNAVYLFERDCSLQRRHQKVIEEAPAPGLSEKLRERMGQAAIQAAKAINYCGAGTVEFLLDVDDSFYFMEMNTRLQVEHPVTEKITGQDLVEWQLKVAFNHPLPLTQEQLQIKGHAFEARIYAEDPNNDFLPATGILSFLQTPEQNQHVRVDSGVRQGDEVSVYYDPMIAKLIVWDQNRTLALHRLAKALRTFRVQGVTTNIDFLYNLATAKPFINAELDTGFIDKHQDLIFHRKSQTPANTIAQATMYLLLAQASNTKVLANNSSDPFSPWHQPNGFRLNGANRQWIDLTLDNTSYQVEAVLLKSQAPWRYALSFNEHTVICEGEIKGDTLICTIDHHRQSVTVAQHHLEQDQYSLFNDDGVCHFYQTPKVLGDESIENTDASFTAPMNGTMVTRLVDIGERVEKEQPLMVMEAMKMEHTIRAPTSGKVTEFYYSPGDLVDGGATLLSFDITEQT